MAAGPDVKAQDTQGDQSTAPSATAAASDDADHDPIASADAATMLRYAAQLATVGDDVALQSLQGYSQAPGFTAPLPALWATVCATMAELVEAMTGGASVLGDEPTKVAAALRARYGNGFSYHYCTCIIYNHSMPTHDTANHTCIFKQGCTRQRPTLIAGLCPAKPARQAAGPGPLGGRSGGGRRRQPHAHPLLHCHRTADRGPCSAAVWGV